MGLRMGRSVPMCAPVGVDSGAEVRSAPSDRRGGADRPFRHTGRIRLHPTMSENLTRSRPPLSERVEAEATVVAVRGELDLQSAPLVRSRLDALTAGPGPDLVLDLRDVSFVDCSGLGVLCRARTRALARHGRMRLVTDSPGLLRVLSVTGLSGVFELYPRLSDALAGVSGPGSASAAG